MSDNQRHVSGSSRTSSRTSSATSSKPTSAVQGVASNYLGGGPITTTATFGGNYNTSTVKSSTTSTIPMPPSMSAKSPLAPGALLSYGGPNGSSSAYASTMSQQPYTSSGYGAHTQYTTSSTTQYGTSGQFPGATTTTRYASSSQFPGATTTTTSTERKVESTLGTGAVSNFVSSGYTQQTSGSLIGKNTTTSMGEMSPSRSEMTRQISNVIVKEEYLEDFPREDKVTYVEVEVLQEVVKHVPRKEIVEVEKRVPKYEYEWVEKIIEIPQIHYVDKQVEVQQIQEVVRHVPKTQIVEVPKEVIRHVPKIETKIVEKLVEVPGHIIEVPKPYTVENKIPVTNFLDADIPVVVAQTVKPIIIQSDDIIEVDVVQHEPEAIPVDVHVIKPVACTAVHTGLHHKHRVVSVPAAQYNTILKLLNTHMEAKELSTLPYQTENGQVLFLDKNVKGSFAIAADDIEIEGLARDLRRRQQSVRRRQTQGSVGHVPVQGGSVMMPNGNVMMRDMQSSYQGDGHQRMGGGQNPMEAATIATLSGGQSQLCCGSRRRKQDENFIMVPETGSMSMSDTNIQTHSAQKAVRAISSSDGEHIRVGSRHSRSTKGGISAMEIGNFAMAANGQVVETLVNPRPKRTCC